MENQHEGIMATVKVIPAEPILFHPAALDEYRTELSTEAQHVLTTRLKAHLSSLPFGRNGQNVEKCAEGLLAGGNGLPAISVLRKQAKRYDLRAYFIVEGGSAVLLYIDPAQRRDKRTEGATQSIAQRRREVTGRTVRLKPLSSANAPRAVARESILPEAAPLAPLTAAELAVAASRVVDAPPPIEDRQAPAAPEAPAAESLVESVRRVLCEFKDDPKGLSPSDIAMLLPGSRSAQSVYDALSSLAARDRAARMEGTHPLRWRAGPRVTETVSVGPSSAPKGYISMILSVVDTYTQRHNGRGPLTREIVQLAKDDGLGNIPIAAAHSTVYTLVESRRLTRVLCADDDPGDAHSRYRYVLPGAPASPAPLGAPRTEAELCVLKALRTYQRLPGARPSGALASDVSLLMYQHGADHHTSGAYGILVKLSLDNGPVTRVLDEQTKMWCFKLADPSGEVYEGAKLPPPPSRGTVKSAHTRFARQQEWAARDAAPKVAFATAPPPQEPVRTGRLELHLPSISPSPVSLPPQPRKGTREQLLAFAADFRVCIGNALASDELTEDECSGALAVLKVIKEYTAKLRGTP